MPSETLLVFSDIHNDYRALERLMDIEADHYVAAGDLVNWGRGLDRCAGIMQRRAGRVWVLPGNHESEEMVERFCSTYGFQNLHGRMFEANGHHVAGLGYSNPTPFNTPGEYSEEEIAKRLANFSALEPLVLICHCPPRDTPLDRIHERLHAGSKSVRDFIERHQPRHFFCGHIHEAEGSAARLGKTDCLNVGKRGHLLALE